MEIEIIDPTIQDINIDDKRITVVEVSNELNVVMTTDKGVPNGVASLDENGLVPEAQLPNPTGDMVKSVYDPTSVESDAFDMDNMVESATSKVLTDTERTNIANNTTHSTSDGTDHANVVLNDTHRGLTNNPHSVTSAQASYDNTGTGLVATNAQDAITELDFVGQQIYYVGKNGNDSNNGKSQSKAFLTIQAALDEALSQTPSVSNRFLIDIIDAGTYVEDLTVYSWCGVYGEGSLIQGNHTVQHLLEQPFLNYLELEQPQSYVLEWYLVDQLMGYHVPLVVSLIMVTHYSL